MSGQDYDTSGKSDRTRLNSTLLNVPSVAKPSMTRQSSFNSRRSSLITSNMEISPDEHVSSSAFAATNGFTQLAELPRLNPSAMNGNIRRSSRQALDQPSSYRGHFKSHSDESGQQNINTRSSLIHSSAPGSSHTQIARLYSRTSQSAVMSPAVSQLANGPRPSHVRGYSMSSTKEESAIIVNGHSSSTITSTPLSHASDTSPYHSHNTARESVSISESVAASPSSTTSASSRVSIDAIGRFFSKSTSRLLNPLSPPNLINLFSFSTSKPQTSTPPQTKEKSVKDIFMSKYRPFEFVNINIIESVELGLKDLDVNSKIPPSDTEKKELDQKILEKYGEPKAEKDILGLGQQEIVKSRNYKDFQYNTHYKIFDFFAIVKLDFSVVDSSLAGILTPLISYRYPKENDESVVSFSNNIPLFCFPELKSSSDPGESSNGVGNSDDDITNSFRFSRETFNFVLTEAMSEKKYGYCKRVESDKRGEQIVLCIISSFGCSQLYVDLLNIISEFKDDVKLLDTFMENLWLQRMPKPGKSISVIANRVKHTISRPLESVTFNDEQTKKLMACFGLEKLKSLSGSSVNFVKLISLLNALILEKRIIFVGKSLQRLSDCCNAAANLIYPLEWQHIFIPILPRRLLEFVCSPTPFIVGILAVDAPRILSKETDIMVENAFIYDLDSQKILKNDIMETDKVMPPYLVNLLKESLESCFSNPDSMSITEAFLKLFSQILGSYRRHMEVDVCKKDNETPQSSLKYSKSFEILSSAETVHVWFHFENFISAHPLLVSSSTLSQQQRPKTALSKDRPPSSQQRNTLKPFLIQLNNLQNFQYFIQEREEALQFHYDQQLSNRNGMQTVKQQEWQQIPAGMKYYYALSQSKFEKMLTRAEMSSET